MRLSASQHKRLSDSPADLVEKIPTLSESFVMLSLPNSNRCDDNFESSKAFFRFDEGGFAGRLNFLVV
jgi:hypothetical protein